MFEKDISEINIIYDIKEENKISIFGSKFVKNNKSICKMILDNQEYEITEEYNIENYKNNNNKLNIILRGINNVTNMSFIFDGCLSLSSLPDILKWNTNKITNIRGIFSGCSSLLSLPDISKWSINNVNDMNRMFYRCSSLSSLPDFLKWNINNVTDISEMFRRCHHYHLYLIFQNEILIMLLI